MRNYSLFSAFIFSMFFIFSNHASADIIRQSRTVSFMFPPVNETVTFDQLSCKIISAKVSMTAKTEHGVVLQNNSPISSASASASGNCNGTLCDLMTSADLGFNGTRLISETNSHPPLNYTVGPLETVTDVVEYEVTGVANILGATNLRMFSGTGTVDFDFSAGTFPMVVSPGNNASFSFATFLGADIELVIETSGQCP